MSTDTRGAEPSLLPCAFCGSEQLERNNTTPDDVACLDCEATTTTAAAWNRRTPPAVAGEPFALLVRKNSWRDGQWEAAPPNSPSYGLSWANQRVYVYTTPQPPQAQAGAVVVTTDTVGRCVAVTRQDDEGRVLSVIWQAPETQDGAVPLTDEQIDAEVFARWGEMKGAPLAMCRGFARAIETEVRKKDEALIREMLESMCWAARVMAISEDEAPGYFAAITAARARLEQP